MRALVRGLCRPGLAQGLGLAGIPVTEASDLASGVRHLAALTQAAAPAVLLVEDTILAAAPPGLTRRLAAQPLPVVLAVPGPARELLRGAGEEEILEILRQAIGYRVRLR